MILLLLACSDLGALTTIPCEAEDLDGDDVAGAYVSVVTGEVCVREFEATDCDDHDRDVHPGAVELCNGIDDDCDGVVDPDADGDGWCGDDCDDGDPLVYPDAPERCNARDDDCDGTADEDLDLDGDGFRSCAGDCDDGDATAYPGAQERCDGVDNDCDGTWDVGAESDLDGDAWRACDGDCDDADAAIHPGAEDLCNGVDDDCSGELDPLDIDGDGDGWLGCEECDDTDASTLPGAPERCDGEDDDCDGDVDEDYDADLDGVTTCAGDCDDADATVYPGATELCNGVDDDCDDAVPNDEVDLDGDGVAECTGDCAPLDAATHPGATELCNGEDDDCDGSPAADEVDADADGGLACEDCDDGDAFSNLLDLDRDGESSCDGDCDDLDASLDARDVDGDGLSLCDDDCDDDDAGRFPGNAEICDFDDDDCDDEVDEGFVDLDGDGAAECVELCNGIDDDSDGTVDEGYTDASWTGTWVDATLPTGDGTAASPYASIQDAIDARSPVTPCPIYVRPATYFESLWIDGGDLELVSTDGAGSTFLDSGGDAPVVYAQSTSDGSRFEGFSVTGASGADGGGLRVEEGYLDVTDNVIYDNASLGGVGAGIYCRNCTGTISGNVVTGNVSELPAFDYGLGAGIAVQYGSAEVTIEDNVVAYNELVSTYGFGGGIGLWATGEVWISRNEILGNRSSYTAGGLSVRDGSIAYVTNNVFVGNGADSSEGAAALELANDGGSWVINNSFVHNHDGWAQVMISWSQGTPYFGNNIVAASDAAGIASWGGTTPQIVYCDVEGGYDGLSDVTGTNGNLAIDPLFVDASDDDDPENDDLTLDAASPCVDAGHSSSSFDDVDGTRNDMGAYGGPDPL